MNLEAKKTVLKWFSYGLYAIGARRGEERNAFTANWVTQTSFEPPLVAVAVENDGHSIALMRDSSVFSVCVYGEEQRRDAALLARPAARVPGKLDEMEWVEGETGAPLLPGTLGYLECRVVEEVATGDHTLFVGEVVAAGTFREGAPLTLAGAGFSYGG